MKDNAVLVQYEIMSPKMKSTVRLSRVPCLGEKILAPNGSGIMKVTDVVHFAIEEFKPVASITLSKV